SHTPAGSDRPVGRVWALPPTGGAAATVGRVVIDNLPNGRHNTNGMAIHRGRLYIANGNATDDGATGGFPELPLNGTLLSIPVGARGLDAARNPPQLQVEARGMRNVYDVAFRPGSDEAWMPTNGPDALEPFGEDLLHMVDVRGPTADMGFPGCVYTASAEGPKFAQNPAVAKTTPCNPRHRRPEQLLGLHVSADGLAFGPDDASWGGDLYIAEFGNLFGTEVTGHKIVRVPMTGGRSSPPVDVARGAGPLDVTFGPAGTGLYVADYASQQISLIRAVG
ncbi:MAG TPA: hypothetical protein VM030_05330, partial [Acidimicrobiales bacterium]|nr:hypothetical protein [Acidimicrobiales bacterium]